MSIRVNLWFRSSLRSLRWISSGIVAAFQTPGGHRRILASDLYKFLQAYGIPIPSQVVEAVSRALGEAQAEERRR